MAKITNQGLNSALHQLWVFSLSGDFWQVLDTAFGTEYNRENAQILRLQWQKGDFSQLPQMEIVDGGILGDGNGAYSSSENRIYLSSKLIEKGTLGLVSKVLIEEIGHYVDAYINTVDSPGDEGAIFAALVQGEGLNKDEISRLKAEEDLASVTIDGKTVEVEKNGSILPVVAWTRLLGTSGIDFGVDLTVGTDGSLYIVGFTEGNLDGSNRGLQDAFIAKYDDNGTNVWKKQFGTVAGDIADAVTISGDGFIYVAGVTGGNLGGQNSTGLGAFIRKYDPDGNEVWTQLVDINTGSLNIAYAVVAGSDSSIYISGSTIDPTQTSVGGQLLSDAFVSKYDSSGTKIWTKLLGTLSGNEEAIALTVGSDQSIYVTGYTEWKLDGENYNGATDVFVSKYDPNGNRIWTRVLGTIEDETPSGLATDSSGFIYVSGTSGGNLDGQPNSGLSDVFISKYSSDGSKVWTKLIGTSGDDLGSLSIGNDNSIYLGVSPDIQLDPNSYLGFQASESFITKYSTNGDQIWKSPPLLTGSNYPTTLTTGKDGSIYLGGITDSNLDGQNNSGSFDVFITKLEDDVPTLAIAPENANQPEGDSGSKAFTFIVNRSGYILTPVSVDYTVQSPVLTAVIDGMESAIGDDFVGGVFPSGRVNFVGNETSKVITVNVQGDTTPEVDGDFPSVDVFTVTLSNATGGATITTATAVGTIQNDDVVVTTPTITLAVNPSSVTEDGTTNLVYTLTRTGDLTNSLIVNVNGGGTAVLGTDFSISGPIGQSTSGSIASVTFAAGSSTATVIVDPIPNSIPGGNKTVFATLAPGAGYNIGTVSAVTGTILDDDVVAPQPVPPSLPTQPVQPAPVQPAPPSLPTQPVRPVFNNELAIASTNATQLEGNTGIKAFTFTVTRSGDTTSDSSANWAVTGFGTNQADVMDFGGTAGIVSFAAGEITKTIIVDVLGDSTVEPDEGFTVTLSKPTNATIATATAVGIIQNDDAGVALPIITLAVNPSSVTEDGPQNLFYIFSRTGDKTNSLTVNFNVSGTATFNDDYTQRWFTSFGTNTGSVTFATGSSVVILPIDPSSDLVSDGNETVALTLAAGTGYAVGTSSAVTGTILDNDVAPGTVVRGSVAKSEYFRTRHEYRNSYAFAALKSDGSVVTWGSSNWGGDSSSVSSSLTSGVTQIFSAEFAFAALKSDGSVVTWGDSDSNYGGNSSSVS
ncbi:Calx-beta domain-containing protein, partial [Cylindrospermopsis raciborskii]|uniref:Calx-beta domain-containing protein n=1 Tax=Cylindrospermopsis raciborskii TaxID=77022 RepID=UPI0038790B74